LVIGYDHIKEYEDIERRMNMVEKLKEEVQAIEGIQINNLISNYKCYVTFYQIFNNFEKEMTTNIRLSARNQYHITKKERKSKG
jgi:hypothetical protein